LPITGDLDTSEVAQYKFDLEEHSQAACIPDADLGTEPMTAMTISLWAQMPDISRFESEDQCLLTMSRGLPEEIPFV